MTNIRVRMVPGPEKVGGESGIKTVVNKYAEHLPALGVELVDDDATSYDILAIHAGLNKVKPGGVVYAHLHGLYWTADYPSSPWQQFANENIVQNMRHAQGVSVPSEWVAETIRRDMRFNPDVLPHGVDWNEWQTVLPNQGHILWAKNRVADVCDPGDTAELARRFPKLSFINTFLPEGAPANMRGVGVVPHAEMQRLIKTAGVYLSTTKETFGVATLEALAAGVPVLGYAHGGNLDLVQHGVTGYLAQPGNVADLVAGLDWIRQHRAVLSENAREAARQWTWAAACARVVAAYQRALGVAQQPASVALVIPVFNKPPEVLERAIASGLAQTLRPSQIIVVDDGSRSELSAVYEQICQSAAGVFYHRKENGGVASARNLGAELAGEVKYLSFLDADDELAPPFLQVCVRAMESDASIHIAYTKLLTRFSSGREKISAWPDAWEYDAQLKRKNQVPTANVLRAETFHRLGGYRGRYAPTGAGSEDAELWTRFGAYGYGAKLVADEPLFLYSLGQGHTSAEGYSEVDWLRLHPWTRDGLHPFASHATPANGRSHLVRQYDEPSVSVIIPVGPKHGEAIINALDTLDAQTFRSWEAIVVQDGGDWVAPWIIKAFPHVRFLRTEAAVGAGAARNLGAKVARGDFLFFLDADDHLHPDCLRMMVDAWSNERAIPYSDYRGVVEITDAAELILQINNDPFRSVVGYDGKTMVIHHDAARRFDCEKAMRQPENPPYIWCLVSCLVPKVWHNEIGGFDEAMPSWEDVEYYWRMAWAGHCFVRVPHDLVIYRFDTGTRREAGLQGAQKLLEYLRAKYKERKPMGCNCNTPKSDLFDQITAFEQAAVSSDVVTFQRLEGGPITVGDADLVRVRYNNSRAGAHRVIGSKTRIAYGRKAGGDVFLVHREDVYLHNGRGDIIPSTVFVPVDEGAPKAAPQVPPAPKRQGVPDEAPVARIQQVADPVKTYALTDVRGIGEKTAEKLRQAGIRTPLEIVVAGEPGLRQAGIAEGKAQEIVEEALRLLGPS